MKKLLRELTEVLGPSGREDAIRSAIRREVRSLADEIRTDALGNLIARKRPAIAAGSRATPSKIMIAAHMDEIGLTATHVDPKGFTRFASVGGVDPRHLPGSRVRFMNGTAGVTGLEPTTTPTENLSIERMFIDVGAQSGKACPIQSGDMACFERPFLELGERVAAKSLDNRAGCAVAIEALRKLGRTPHDVYFVFTTQEEFGSAGLRTSAYGINPDLGISVDVTPCGDTPGMRGSEVCLGTGPAVKIRDSAMLSDPRVVQWMVRTAERREVPYQREVLVEHAGNAQEIQMVRGGVPVGGVSIPCRYIHSPSEMVDLRDLANAAKLIVALLRAPVKLV